jgi:hypothetical protein
LDHLLVSVLDAKITSKIVRLGSRSSDERISQYSIENLERIAGKSRLNHSFNGQYRALKDVEEQLRKLITRYVKTTLDSEEIIQYLEIQYPEELDQLNHPPVYVSTLRAASWDDDRDGMWQRAGARGRAQADDNSIYGYWRSGRDLEFLQGCENPPPPPLDLRVNTDQNKFSTLANLDPDSRDDLHSEEDESDEDDSDTDDCSPEELWMKVKPVVVPKADPNPTPQTPLAPSIPTSLHAQVMPSAARRVEPSDMRDPLEFFNAFGFNSIPHIPASDRPLEQLLEVGAVWTMSRSERARLHSFWMTEAQTFLNAAQIQDFERLRSRHADVLRGYNEGKDEASSFRSF